MISAVAAGVQAQDTIDLSGEWLFMMDCNNGQEPPKRFDDNIILPGSMLTNGKGKAVDVNTEWVGSLYDSSYFFNPYMARYREQSNFKVPFFLTPSKHYVGTAWYQREIIVPKSWRGHEVTLTLERPHIETTVWVNGKLVGHEMSLSSPHQFSVTPYIRFGRKNVVSIRIYNGIENVGVGQDSHSVTDQTQGNWNGIAGSITMSARPRIERLIVQPDIKTATARVIINDDTLTVNIPRPLRLWSEHDPYRYTAKIRYKGAIIPVRIGMREVATDGRDITLNGKRIHLRGTVENCCFPETGFPPTDLNSWLRIIGTCKAYGLNHMRFHSYCPPEAAFEAADSLGFYMQAEGPSWPNHGVKLGVGMIIDQYLVDECHRIVDSYGSHPSLIMVAAGNEPAGNWVQWGQQFCNDMRHYDPSRIYATASVGGGWQWDEGSDYHVKGGARGLDWSRHRPQTMDDFSVDIATPRNFKPTESRPVNIEPYISHEQGQWCAFPDLSERNQYTGAYKAKNFDIFADLLRDNGMEEMAEQFLMASGKLQVLCYRFEIERHLRTPHYAGFQLLGLNDYSGQGTALVGPLNVHWQSKGYVTPEQWRSFCSDIVPLAKMAQFVYTQADTISIGTTLYNTTSQNIGRINYTLSHNGQQLAGGSVAVGDVITFPASSLPAPAKLQLTLSADTASNSYDLWVYPSALPSFTDDDFARAGIMVTDELDSLAIATLHGGGKVLLTACGKIKYGNDVRHSFLPVFWNTSWFKMKPPHTTGAYIQATHPVFADFPTDDWQDLQWWELTNRAQCINLSEFPSSYQPIIQPIDTWHVSRKLGMMVEVQVEGGSLLLTTLDISNNLDERPVARQLRYSLLRYMSSEAFWPAVELPLMILQNLFNKEAPPVQLFTNDSPDELKPVIN
ncbi:MAG: beta-glucuronidase [Bacteroidaceae bacterium]|nr:beta-glucuronidase [Bacteroidaceae bacterium]